jgi:hypothetical protein
MANWMAASGELSNDLDVPPTPKAVPDGFLVAAACLARSVST